MPVRVAPLTEQDVATAATQLAGLPLLQRYSLGQEALANLLRGALHRQEGLLCATDEGAKPLGVAWYLPRGGFGTAGYLRLLLVAEGHAGRGVGSALLAAFEAGCGQPRGGFFALTETPDGAGDFYRSRGYQPIGELPGFVRQGQSELLLWKRP